MHYGRCPGSYNTGWWGDLTNATPLVRWGHACTSSSHVSLVNLRSGLRPSRSTISVLVLMQMNECHFIRVGCKLSAIEVSLPLLRFSGPTICSRQGLGGSDFLAGVIR